MLSIFYLLDIFTIFDAQKIKNTPNIVHVLKQFLKKDTFQFYFYIIIFIFIHSGKKKPKPVVFAPPENRKEGEALDTETLCRMVSRLLINGWTNKQIAKELKLPEEEVERLVKLSHQGNYI